jgi:AcrR family transcriptional regulator
MANRPRSGTDTDAVTETRSRVLRAALEVILEVGYYRASSNEIARRAGVSWGVIQHHFGTREKLMLAVFAHGQRELGAIVERGVIDAPTLEGRLEQLLDILAEYYGAPEFLVHLQVQLDLAHSADTSDEVRALVHRLSERTIDDVVRLTRDALGPAYSPDTTSTIFLTLRGYAMSELLAKVTTHDDLPTGADDERRRRRILAAALAPYFEAAARRSVRSESRPRSTVLVKSGATSRPTR